MVMAFLERQELRFGSMPVMAGSPDAPARAKCYRLARVSKCFEKWRTSILSCFFKAQLKRWKNNAKGPRDRRVT